MDNAVPAAATVATSVRLTSCHGRTPMLLVAHVCDGAIGDYSAGLICLL